MKLTILAKKLSSLQLYKEASDVIRLKPLEHPDWKDEWEEPKDYSPEEIAPQGLPSGEVNSPESKTNEILADLHITIISGEGNEPLGSGSHGKVYRSIYNGKPSVTKIQVYKAILPRQYAQDVSRWEKLMSIWDSVPDFVRKHIPEVFLAKEGEFIADEAGGPVEYKYQIMVMEELRPISKKLKFSIEGDGWPGNKDSAWLWEEELENLYLEILEKFTDKGFDPPTRGEIRKIILEDINHGKSIESKLTKFINEKLGHPFLAYDEERDPDKVEVYFKLSDYIRDLSKRFSRSIPRWKQKHDLPRYVPPDVQSFSTAIDWLRDNGMNAGDILGDNVMIDSSGTLKIADLGCL